MVFYICSRLHTKSFTLRANRHSTRVYMLGPDDWSTRKDNGISRTPRFHFVKVRNVSQIVTSLLPLGSGSPVVWSVLFVRRSHRKVKLERPRTVTLPPPGPRTIESRSSLLIRIGRTNYGAMPDILTPNGLAVAPSIFVCP